MDVNDIDSRLKRVHASIESVLILDHDKLVSFSEEKGDKPGSTSIVMHLGSRDQDDKWALVENVIAALARLKDNLKNRMKELGQNPQLVENEINNSLVLQLIIDLDNAAKHGYPLTKPERSQKSPKLINLTSSIRVLGSATAEEIAERLMSDVQNDTVTSGARTTYDFVNNTQTYRSAPDTIMVINAEVVDGNMNYIVDLDDMIQDAILKWEMFITNHKLKVQKT